MHALPPSDAATVERFYAAWNSGDVEGVVSAFDPHGEFRPIFGLLHSETHYRGRQGITAWFREFHDSWDEYRFEPQRILQAGSHIVISDGGSRQGPRFQNPSATRAIRRGRLLWRGGHCPVPAAVARRS